MMAMDTNIRSQGEERPSSEAEKVAMSDESPEVWCSEESLSGGEGLISGQGRRGGKQGS